MQASKSVTSLQLALQPLINDGSDIGRRPDAALRKPDDPVVDVHPVIGKPCLDLRLIPELALIIQSGLPADAFFRYQIRIASRNPESVVQGGNFITFAY